MKQAEKQSFTIVLISIKIELHFRPNGSFSFDYTRLSSISFMKFL